MKLFHKIVFGLIIILTFVSVVNAENSTEIFDLSRCFNVSYDNLADVSADSISNQYKIPNIDSDFNWKCYINGQGNYTNKGAGIFSLSDNQINSSQLYSSPALVNPPSLKIFWGKESIGLEDKNASIFITSNIPEGIGDFNSNTYGEVNFQNNQIGLALVKSNGSILCLDSSSNVCDVAFQGSEKVKTCNFNSWSQTPYNRKHNFTYDDLKNGCGFSVDDLKNIKGITIWNVDTGTSPTVTNYIDDIKIYNFNVSNNLVFVNESFEYIATNRESFFFEDFEGNAFLYDKANCSNDYLTKQQAIPYNKDWYCAYNNNPNQVIIWAISGVNDIVGSPTSRIMEQHLGTADTSTQHLTLFTELASDIELEADDEFSFYCNATELEDNTSAYLILSPKSTAPTSKVTAIGLTHTDDFEYDTAYLPSPTSSNSNFCDLKNITGNYCSETNGQFSFTVQDIIDNCAGATISDFDTFGRIDFWQNVRTDDASDTWYFDDINISRVVVETPPNISDVTYFEDFEDTNFTVYDLGNMFNKKTYVGSTENPIIETYYAVFTDDPETENLLQRVSDTPDGSNYAILGNSTYIATGSSSYDSGVTLVDVDVSSYGINLSPETNFSFSAKAVYNHYIINDGFFGFSISTATDSVTMVLDEPSNPCSSDNVTGKNISSSWQTFSFSLQDMLDNGCDAGSNDVTDLIGGTLTSVKLYTQWGSVSNTSDAYYYAYVDNLGFDGLGTSLNSLPTINTFTASNNNPEPDETVTFSISATDPESDQIRYAMFCDDGGNITTDPSTGLNLTFDWTTILINFECTYDSSGVKEVVLYYSDSVNYPTRYGSQSKQITVSENITVSIKFIETFGKSLIDYDEDDCTTNGYTSTQLQGFATEMDFGNHSWYCFQDTKASNYISFSNESDTTKINTPQGLNIYSSTSLSLSEKTRKVSALLPTTDVDLQANDSLSFSCMIPDQSDGVDVFLYLGEWDDADPVLIALGKDSGLNRCGQSSLPTGALCCELDDIVGSNFDCKSDSKVQVDVSISTIANACAGIGELDFQDLQDIGFWISEKEFWGSSDIYIDDLAFTQQSGLVGNNTLPQIASIDPDPDPVNVSEQVSWLVYVWDDDPQEEIYTAFDCDNDASLEYSWAKRPVYTEGGFNVSKVWEFNCTYGSVGTKTAKAYVSDDTHYPSQVRTSTSTVDVELIEEQESGGGCEGFIAPSCSGDCRLFDNFYYTGYPITCNGWVGTDRHPNDEGKFVIVDMNFTETNIYNDFAEISSEEFNTALFRMDFKETGDSRVTLKLIEDTAGYGSLYIYWDNGYLYALDSVSPYVTNLGNYTKGVEYTLESVIDFPSQTITHTVFGYDTTVEFFESEAESITEVSMNWDSITTVNMTIDDIYVGTGEENIDYTVPDVEIDYTYDPDFFCAINWTGEDPHFSIDNCEARGYPITGSLLGLCVPRACVSDTVSALFNWALENILVTIVVVIAFILIAPLIVKAGSSKR